MQFDLFDSQTNDILSHKSYDSFASALRQSNCRKCSLSQSRTQIVVDRGNPKAKIFVIGEAPGENEDLQGKAFVGRAGKLFDKVMESVGLDTNQDMLIGNVAKCRPPENRAPRQEEAAACMPFLMRQIELAQPNVILLLGATALRYFDPQKKNFSMEEEAGNFFSLAQFPNVSFMVLYHPAALLYNSNLKPAMWE
ncbi:MAG: uracil-DNA glycosylase, partial [Elusimicrobia bacterium]|nr:uracil-DNA glycosylase [Elusimicrobiota bacterium]